MNVMKLSYALVILLTILLSGCRESQPVISDKPTVFSALKSSVAPAVDGVITDDCWKTAEVYHLMQLPDGVNPDLPTTVRALWDDTNLYFAFECSDTDAASTITERDGAILREDHVAVLIDADSTPGTFTQIAIAPSGAVFDSFVLMDDTGEMKKYMADWNCDGLQSSVTVYGGGYHPGTEDRFWTVEMKLPLNQFLTAPSNPPKAGDTWSINITRLDVTGKKEQSSLLPMESENTKKPDIFALLQFGGI